MKETAIVKNGYDKAVWKDPITDDGTKKSAKGRVAVIEEDGKQILVDGLTKEDLSKYYMTNLLKPVFRDGTLIQDISLTYIRDNINKGL